MRRRDIRRHAHARNVPAAGYPNIPECFCSSIAGCHRYGSHSHSRAISIPRYSARRLLQRPQRHSPRPNIAAVHRGASRRLRASLPPATAKGPVAVSPGRPGIVTSTPLHHRSGQRNSSPRPAQQIQSGPPAARRTGTRTAPSNSTERVHQWRRHIRLRPKAAAPHPKTHRAFPHATKLPAMATAREGDLLPKSIVATTTATVFPSRHSMLFEQRGHGSQFRTPSSRSARKR